MPSIKENAHHKSIAFALHAAPLMAGAASAQTTVVNKAITETEVLAAQKGLCLPRSWKSATPLPPRGCRLQSSSPRKWWTRHMATSSARCFFKPTLAAAHRASHHAEGAISYFVGGDQLSRMTTASRRRTGRNAISRMLRSSSLRYRHDHGQCAVHGQGRQGDGGRQDLGVREDNAGKMRIMVHNSSLPFVGD